MDNLFIRDLRVRGIIGVHPWEREQPQEFVVNLDIRLDLARAAQTDNLADCLDYEQIARAIGELARSAQRYTVEAFAADVAATVLAEPLVHRVRVRVEKPGAVPGCRSVGVEIDRARSSTPETNATP